MNKHNRINLGMAIGGGALAAYAGFTGASWFRYGHRTTPHTDSLLQQYMEIPEVADVNEIEVKAPRKAIWEACMSLDMLQSRTIRAIFDARALLMRSPKREIELPKPLLEQARAIGWDVLDEATGREIVFGAAVKPWRGDIAVRAIPREEFAAFDEPGWAKIVWNVSITQRTKRRCVVRTETRVATTDPASRRIFRLYWAFASPFVTLIRRIGLRLVKAAAEGRNKS
jgi:hypothetical protein